MMTPRGFVAPDMSDAPPVDPPIEVAPNSTGLAPVPPVARGARLRRKAPYLALAALAGALASLLALAWAFPHVFYYPVVWKHLWGPTVSDAAGTPLTRGGVTAYPGYNLVDTTTYALVLGVSLWALLHYLKERDIRLTRTLTFALVPMIVAGGTMRGLVELDWLPAPWSYAFITPYIYFVFFFYTLVALFLGVVLEGRTRRVEHWHVPLAAGVLATAVTWVGWASFVLPDPAGARWVALFEIFGYSAALTAVIVAALWTSPIRFVRDPLYVLVLYGQIVDGMQNYIGITRGYVSKLMGPNFLAGLFGDPGLLIGKVLLLVPILAYVKHKVEPEEDPNMTQLLLLAILALGLAMGFHGGVPMLVGD